MPQVALVLGAEKHPVTLQPTLVMVAMVVDTQVLPVPMAVRVL